MIFILCRARRQDSVTGAGGGGIEINFWGAQKVYLCKFDGGTVAREVYSSVEQTKKVKAKKKRSSGQTFPQILVVVSKSLQFSTNSYVKTKKKVFVPKYT